MSKKSNVIVGRPDTNRVTKSNISFQPKVNYRLGHRNTTSEQKHSPVETTPEKTPVKLMSKKNPFHYVQPKTFPKEKKALKPMQICKKGLQKIIEEEKDNCDYYASTNKDIKSTDTFSECEEIKVAEEDTKIKEQMTKYSASKKQDEKPVQPSTTLVTRNTIFKPKIMTSSVGPNFSFAGSKLVASFQKKTDESNGCCIKTQSLVSNNPGAQMPLVTEDDGSVSKRTLVNTDRIYNYIRR